jgi:hypothetical protein
VDAARVRADGFLLAQMVNTFRGVNATARRRPDDVRRRPDEKDVQTVNFTVGRPFRHPWTRPPAESPLWQN